MSQRQRLVLLGLAVLVAAVALLVAGTGDGGDDDVIDTRTTATVAETTPAGTTSTSTAPAQPQEAKPRDPAPPTVVVRDGQPVGGVERFRFRKGSTIVLVVRSDAPAHVHLHGYDVLKDVEAGGSARFSVPAKIDGRFEVELEDTATLIAEVEVVP